MTDHLAAVPPLEHRDVAHLTEDEWLEQLVASIDDPSLRERRWPGFPDESTQRAFVGSAWAEALDEGRRFYGFVKEQMEAIEVRAAGGRYLDFGVGWGRLARFFLRDFERGEMATVDVDPGMVAFCRQAEVPGHHLTIRQGEPLPFADGAFRLVTAYSVFTHLPEAVFQSWMSELLRVVEPGGMLVLTLEPERFLDFVAGIDPVAPESGWHAALAAELGPVEARRDALRTQGFTYLPTGGGPHRGPDVYGDMVVTPEFVERSLGGTARLVTYLDDPARFWQAVAVVERPLPLDPIAAVRPLAREARRRYRRHRRSRARVEPRGVD